MSAPSRALVIALALLLVGPACTYTTTASAPARGALWIDDEPAGEVSPEGAEVRVPVTYLDPTWRLSPDEDDRADASGVLARTRLEPVTTASLCSCSALAVPACGALGVLLANPSTCVLCLAPLSEVFFVSGTNALRTTADSASWATVPVVAACALVGFAPLALLPLTLRVPEEVELPLVEGLPPSSTPAHARPRSSNDEPAEEVRY